MDSESETGSSQLSLWNLPEELLVCILKSLHIKDILNMRAVNSCFRDMVDDCSAVWKAASFQDTWPSSNNLPYFEKAAECGNMEALIKLAVAYLYNEGIPGDFDAEKMRNNGIKAAELFCEIETMTPFAPFTWLFLRPSSSTCTREHFMIYKVIGRMGTYVRDNIKQDTKNVIVCFAKTLRSLDDRDEEQVAHSDVLLDIACQLGSGSAAFMLWTKDQQDVLCADRARQLESIRLLRAIANMDDLDAKLSLCNVYANGEYGGITQKQAAMFVRELAQSTTPANTKECLGTSRELTIKMWYVLVNSLVDIASEKNFSSDAVHIVVSLVERYLKCRTKTTRSELQLRYELQLVGVSAMAICSRFLQKDIITIREAAWLVDSATKPADVVKMMGEIVATLKGNIRVPNSLDFVRIFSRVAELDKKCSCLAEYVCELTLLHADMGQYSPAEIAASSVLLARLLMKLDLPWPDQMVEFSGFTVKDIEFCVFDMHIKCFLVGSVKVDDQHVRLEAINQRYAEDEFHQVSKIPIMNYQELCAMLDIPHDTCVCEEFRNADESNLSPPRKKRKCERVDQNLQDRGNAAAPSIEDSFDFLGESDMSG